MITFKNITLRRKTVILLITLTGFYLFLINMEKILFSQVEIIIKKEQKHDKVQESVGEIVDKLLILNISIQDMLGEGIINFSRRHTDRDGQKVQGWRFSSYIDDIKFNFANQINVFKDKIQFTKNLTDNEKSLNNVLELFEKEIDRLNEKFSQVVLRREIIGFTEEEGLYGVLRKVIHRVEKSLEQLSRDDVVMSLIEMRRREKDFFSRRHQNSINLYYDSLSRLIEDVSSITEQEASFGKKIAEDLELYSQIFSGLREELELFDKDKAELLQIISDILDKIVPLKLEILNNLRAQSVEEHQKSQTKVHHIMQITTTIIFILMGGMIYYLFYSIQKPIIILQSYALRIAQGHYEENISLSGNDEIGQLACHLQTMKEAMRQHNRELEIKIALRTEHLEMSNTALKDTINDLKRLQSELISSEKMASLGRLVAGFAHEINTPIGVALTSTSTIPDTVKSLEQMLEEDEIEESDLLDIFKRLNTSSELAQSNLRRASDIVTRFKRTSVDQSSEDKRNFDLLDTLEDVVSSVHNVFKRSSIVIKIDCPKKCTIMSQPGSLGQVITNLLLNSHKHAYNNGNQSGHIVIKAGLNRAEDHVNITFIDDGKGMEPQLLEKIFEPFFTTARDSGGSGLGLYICFNIITAQLMGQINCKSIFGKGTQFFISFPISVD